MPIQLTAFFNAYLNTTNIPSAERIIHITNPQKKKQWSAIILSEGREPFVFPKEITSLMRPN